MKTLHTKPLVTAGAMPAFQQQYGRALVQHKQSTGRFPFPNQSEWKRISETRANFPVPIVARAIDLKEAKDLLSAYVNLEGNPYPNHVIKRQLARIKEIVRTATPEQRQQLKKHVFDLRWGARGYDDIFALDSCAHLLGIFNKRGLTEVIKQTQDLDHKLVEQQSDNLASLDDSEQQDVIDTWIEALKKSRLHSFYHEGLSSIHTEWTLFRYEDALVTALVKAPEQMGRPDSDLKIAKAILEKYVQVHSTGYNKGIKDIVRDGLDYIAINYPRDLLLQFAAHIEEQMNTAIPETELFRGLSYYDALRKIEREL